MFCVQPYSSKPHRLVAEGAKVFNDADAALAAGRRMARRRAGVVVLSQDVDATSGCPGRPRIIAIHGTVPHRWRDAGGTSITALTAGMVGRATSYAIIGLAADETPSPRDVCLSSCGLCWLGRLPQRAKTGQFLSALRLAPP